MGGGLFSAAYAGACKVACRHHHTQTVLDRLAGRLSPQAQALATTLAQNHHFFHWPLEFPEVFQQGGFDIILSNPPWEMIQLEEKKFFADRDSAIPRAPNAAARKRLIQALETTKPALWEQYQNALHTAESTSRFLRGSGQYPLTSSSRINTYSVFAERIRALLRPTGRVGLLLPTGIATDDNNQHFFASLLKTHQLLSLFDFENRGRLFPAIDSRMKLSLLTLRKEKPSEEMAEAYPVLGDQRGKEIPYAPFRWEEGRRAQLRAELDAYYARLYGLSRKQLQYLLDPADLTEGELQDILDLKEVVRDPLETVAKVPLEASKHAHKWHGEGVEFGFCAFLQQSPLDPTAYQERIRQSQFPGETFRVLKENEIEAYGEYRTRRLVLEAWERLP